MEKKNNKDKISFRVTSDFLKAYDTTLEKAAGSKYGKSDFLCASQCQPKFSLDCKECPLDCCDGGDAERTFEQWQDWFHKLTGVKDNRTKDSFMQKNEQIKESIEDDIEKVDYQAAKEIAGNYTLGNIADVAQTNFNLFIKELKEKAKAKYEVEYTTLDSDEPRKEYVRKVVDLLSLIKEWNKEAIKWNLIANGNISKIPTNFKDIYIKVYDPEEGVALFQDEYTLKSKGLKLAWTRDN